MVRQQSVERRGWLALVWFLSVAAMWTVKFPAWPADAGTDYPGTVVMVDSNAGKLGVKKEGGGSRFTFVVTDQTQFDGGIKSLKDLKQGAGVVVKYVVNGSQYVALKITRKPQ